MNQENTEIKKVQSFDDLKREMLEDRQKQLVKITKDRYQSAETMKAQRLAWAKRRQDEVKELEVLQDKVRHAYETGDAQLLRRTAEELCNFEGANRGRSRKYYSSAIPKVQVEDIDWGEHINVLED